jgi:hypothetical protein
LPNSLATSKIWTNFIIHFHTQSAIGHHIFDPDKPAITETFLGAAVKQEIPIDFVICIFKINLQNNPLLFPKFAFSQNFMEQHNPISDVSLFNKCCLTLRQQFSITGAALTVSVLVKILNNTCNRQIGLNF